MLGRVCLVHPDHVEDEPMVLHHVRPRPRGGGDSQTIQVCANAHGRIHFLLDEIEAYAVASPYATMAEVVGSLPHWSNFDLVERSAALRGWEMYGIGFLGGRYAVAYRYWRTDGAPRDPNTPHFDDLYHAARWSRKWRRELDAL